MLLKNKLYLVYKICQHKRFLLKLTAKKFSIFIAFEQNICSLCSNVVEAAAREQHSEGQMLQVVTLILSTTNLFLWDKNYDDKVIN